jgi:hypothetical protein
VETGGRAAGSFQADLSLSVTVVVMGRNYRSALRATSLQNCQRRVMAVRRKENPNIKTE